MRSIWGSLALPGKPCCAYVTPPAAHTWTGSPCLSPGHVQVRRTKAQSLDNRVYFRLVSTQPSGPGKGTSGSCMPTTNLQSLPDVTPSGARLRPDMLRGLHSTVSLQAQWGSGLG